MKRTKNMIYKESIESRELTLYAENDSRVYFNAIVPTVKNLAKKYNKGVFDKEKAVDAFYYVADYAAKMYCKEFARMKDYVQTFSVTDRFTAAVDLLGGCMENIENNDL